ncbi:MAG TPA: carbohydrate ABC transporter permease [Candidatus Eisenbacteria bacterium]|nr:carbohydrate ABC transporter permease [Candidatus Eisenbacteria bacterium]
MSARAGRSGVWIYAALAAISLLSLAPLLYMMRISFGAGGDLPIAPSDWWGKPFTLDHYRDLWTGGPMGRFGLNSVIVTGVAVPIQVLLAAAAGHALARSRFLGQGALLALATAFLILPKQVLLVPLYLLFANAGMLDTYPALVLPHLADPFGVLFMAHYYQTLTPELEEAARTDGLGAAAIFWRIVLPVSGPGLAVVGVNGFLTTWNAFLHPLVLTTSETMRTLPVGLALFAQSEHGTDWGILLAGSTLATIPVVLAFVLFQRQIVEGILKGSSR